MRTIGLTLAAAAVVVLAVASAKGQSEPKRHLARVSASKLPVQLLDDVRVTGAEAFDGAVPATRRVIKRSSRRVEAASGGVGTNPTRARASRNPSATPVLRAANDRYLVRTTSAPAARTVASDVAQSIGPVHHRFGQVIDGFAATLSPAEAAALQDDPRVVSVVPDQPTYAAATQLAPPWGLDRIDQRGTAGDDAYRYDTTGTDVTVFVLDTGIRSSHTQFEGRASSGYDFVDDDTDASDCYGHGTHVAGTIGGKDYGVAKNVKLVSLRIWGCDNRGSSSDMIAALDWVVAHKPSGPAVVNISGGGGAYAPIDAAVAATTAAGIPVVVAAMNKATDACTVSPARAPSAITVGASDITDARAYFSDYGPCVDMFAPGVEVLSSLNTSNTATASWSGTSMATPHVTGAVARYLETHPTASPSAVAAAMVSTATPHAVSDALSAGDGLLYIDPPPDVVSPTVTITQPTSGQTGVSANADIVVTFSEPMDQPATAAAFSLRRSADGTVVPITTSWAGNTLIADPVADLGPGHSYSVSISTGARDTTGNTLSAAVGWTFTVGTVTPGAPTSVFATKDNSARSATLSWSPPSNNGGSAISGYRVARDGTDGSGTGPWSTTLPANAGSFTFLNLVVGQTYTLTVQALNASGTSLTTSAAVTIEPGPLPEEPGPVIPPPGTFPPSDPTPGTPLPLPTPTPIPVVSSPVSATSHRTISEAQALRQTRTALRRMYKSAFTKGKSRTSICRRNSATKRTCTVRWRYKRYIYRGRVVVTLTDTAYSTTVFVKRSRVR